MFTAFDVTQAIRKESAGVHVLHSAVRNYVHDKFPVIKTSYGYSRVLAPFGSPQPWIYYIPGVHQVENYNPNPAADGGTVTVTHSTVNRQGGGQMVATPTKPGPIAAIIAKFTGMKVHKS